VIRVSLYKHIPHALMEARRKAGPVKVDDQRNLKHPNPVIRFNSRLALICTVAVGSMWCAYVFGILAVAGLPTALKPGISSDFLQLTLLSVIIVGQNLQAASSDKRSEQTFQDGEIMLHEQAQQAAHLAAQDDKILEILREVQANTALTAEARDALLAATIARMQPPPPA
jgi:hypothetical protein